MVWLLAFLLSLSLSFGIEILSKTLYTDEDGKVIAEGEVFAEYGEYTVRAHRVVYDPRSRTVFAYGNVRIKKKDGSFEVEGEEAFLDLEKEKGYFLDARGRFKSFYFSAKRVEKRDKEEYIVLEGDITTCPPDDKEMKVCFWKAHVSDRYVISFSNSLRFFKIPIAYFPLVILPTGERRSGLLPPIVGQDTYNTFIYIQPFYWAISGDRDATLTVDYRDRQARGLSLEYRQAFTEETNLYGRISYYAEPFPPGEWWEGRERTAFRKNRFRAELLWRWGRWELGLDIPSDPYFLEDFYFSRRERTRPFTLSYLTYVRSEKDYLFYFNLRNFYDLTSPTNERTTSLLPEVGFYSRQGRVGPFFLSLSSIFSHFYSEKNPSSRRLVFTPRVEAPVRFWGVQNYSSLEFINNFYFSRNSPYTDERVTSFKFENRTPLFWDFEVIGVSFPSTLELLYTFSPENFNNPQFDPLDEVVRENNLKVRVSSSALIGDRMIGSLFLEGGYNFLGSYRFPTAGGIVEKELLPFRAILSLYPVRGLVLSEDMTYDANLGVLARSVSSANFSHKNLRLSVSYITAKDRRDRRVVDQYALGSEIRAGGFFIGGSLTVDNRSGKELFRSARVGYRGACWTAKIDYRSTYYGEEKGYINEVFFVFSVFNLKDFKLPLRRR